MQLTKKLTLASKSQIRAQVLAGAGIAFDVAPSGVDEDALKAIHSGDAAGLAVGLAEAKAKAVSAEGLIIGADQVLQCEGVLYDKPRDMAEARANLKKFRGRTHYLIGGVVLVEGGETVWAHHQKVSLVVRDFSDAFLDAYLEQAGESILASVGCYQLEGLGSHLFDSLDGDYFSTLGLPLLPLLQALRDHGSLAR
ncbi:MAG: Maf-like protein [Rhodobiaceae bacterium]|jgi:septum formation protein|nr:Maf-like protein [Rhodobiaceae bacterium]